MFQAISKLHGIIAMAVHTNSQCFQTFGKYPCIEWRNSWTRWTAKSVNLINQLLVANQYSTCYAALSINPFGTRMAYQVRSKINWALQIGRGKAVVYMENYTMLLCQFSYEFKVNYIQTRVRWCFSKNHLGIWLNGFFPTFQIIYINVCGCNTETRQNLRQKRVRRTKHRTTAYNMISSTEQCRKTCVHCSHTSSSGITSLCAF